MYYLLHRTTSVKTDKSNIVYLQVPHAKSESRDTPMAIFFDLHKCKGGKTFFADAKLYEVIQALKHEYGEELRWVFPFPGD